MGYWGLRGLGPQGKQGFAVSLRGFQGRWGLRCWRYGHRGLPAEEQTVTTQLFVTMLPKWLPGLLGFRVQPRTQPFPMAESSQDKT